LRTGDDRNAYDTVVARSRSISAMECGGSVVRAILTVSIVIFAPALESFKIEFFPVQRKGIKRKFQQIFRWDPGCVPPKRSGLQ
jgi:hypothetical protein